MKNSKKYLTGLAAASFVLAMVVPGHAAFTSKGVTTLSASATTGGTPVIAITSALIKNRAGDSTVSSIGWTGATVGGGWLVADQYIELKTNITTTSGGIQIYTDNTHATPAYTGVISSNTASPAGLVSANGTQKLPTAWRASTFTLVGVNPVNPNQNAGESFLWFFHEDVAQVLAPSQNATAFANGDPFITVYAAPSTILTGQSAPVSGGVHFAQDPTSFGGFQTAGTTEIYTEADFTTALAQQTYSTNKLILEAFSL